MYATVDAQNTMRRYMSTSCLDKTLTSHWVLSHEWTATKGLQKSGEQGTFYLSVLDVLEWRREIRG